MSRYLKTAMIILALGATQTVAGTPMDAEEFDSYTRGKTLFYGQQGATYGAEIYMDNRRVRWSFLDGQCKEGTWYEDAGQICFVYEDNPTPQCWTFRESGTGLTANFSAMPGATELYEADPAYHEMICLGPEVGV